MLFTPRRPCRLFILYFNSIKHCFLQQASSRGWRGSGSSPLHTERPCRESGGSVYPHPTWQLASLYLPSMSDRSVGNSEKNWTGIEIQLRWSLWDGDWLQVGGKSEETSRVTLCGSSGLFARTGSSVIRNNDLRRQHVLLAFLPSLWKIMISSPCTVAHCNHMRDIYSDCIWYILHLHAFYKGKP